MKSNSDPLPSISILKLISIQIIQTGIYSHFNQILKNTMKRQTQST